MTHAEGSSAYLPVARESLGEPAVDEAALDHPLEGQVNAPLQGRVPLKSRAYAVRGEALLREIMEWKIHPSQVRTHK